MIFEVAWVDSFIEDSFCLVIAFPNVLFCSFYLSQLFSRPFFNTSELSCILCFRYLAILFFLLQEGYLFVSLSVEANLSLFQSAGNGFQAEKFKILILFSVFLFERCHFLLNFFWLFFRVLMLKLLLRLLIVLVIFNFSFFWVFYCEVIINRWFLLLLDRYLSLKVSLQIVFTSLQIHVNFVENRLSIGLIAVHIFLDEL